MKNFPLLALAAVASSLAACSSDPDAGATGPATGHATARSALARDAAPNLTDAEKAALAASSEGFTTRLVGALRAESPDAVAGNLAFSPVSIATALSMPYAGARGATAAQIAQALGWTVPQARVAKAFNWATLGYGGRAATALEAARRKAAGDPSSPAPDAASFRLHLVNSVWARQDVRFEAPFLDTLAVDYGAGVTLADFAGNPDGERRAINGWVAGETQQKIQDLIPSGSITRDTAVVLVNAVHLKLPWPTVLGVEAQAAPFAIESGAPVQARFVAASGSYPYAEDASAQAVEIPLEGGEVAFLLVVPKQGLASFEGALATNLPALRGALARKEANVSLPKFTFTSSSVSLAKPLKALGLVDAFDEGKADFSGITGSQRLFFSDVLHKAMIGLDEKGVEAAAATAVVMAGTSAPTDPPKVVRADKPFFFAIVDKPTNTLLFAGHVKDPTR
jgi:serpin B